MEDAPVVKISARSLQANRADAGVFEDCEEEIQRFLECRGIPLGKTMGAIITLLHRSLQIANPAMTREDVRAGLAVPDFAQAAKAVAWSLGFEAAASSGEAPGPTAST